MSSSILTPDAAVEPLRSASDSPTNNAQSNDAKRKPTSKIFGWLAATWRFFVGVVLCQHLLASLLVVGWTNRIMRRRVLYEWWRGSPSRSTGIGFPEFLHSDSRFQAAAALPHWIGPEEQTTTGWRWCRSLVDNAMRGIAATANLCVIVLPGAVLWYYAWVLGWTISFNKVYEQSHLGALLGFTGIALFAAAMLYAPIALARQAFTNSPAVFYQWKFNWRLVRYGAWGHARLAALFAVLALPLMVIKVAPYFVGHDPAFQEFSTEELAAWLRGYYFWTGMILLPLFLLAWRQAAKTYARAALVMSRLDDQRGNSRWQSSWHAAERQTLHALGYSSVTVNQPSPVWLPRRVAGSLSTACGLAVAWAAWSVLSLQVFVSQFFNYVPGMGWLNPPLVILPYLRYLPPGLVD